MRINSINSYNTTNYKNNNTSFQGLNIQCLKPYEKSAKELDRMHDTFIKMGNIIGVKTSVIENLVENEPANRFTFMKTLVTKYNSRNFTKEHNKKENPDALLNIFKMVKNPDFEHRNIINRTQASFSTIENIFELAQDKKSLEFVQKMQHNILDGSKNSANHIIEMLKSPNRKLYLENSEDFASYLKLNSGKKNAIKTLDETIQNGTFDRKIYDGVLEIQNLMKSKTAQNILGKQTGFLEKNYTPQSAIFLKHFIKDFLKHKKELTPQNLSDILQIYKSTNKKNLALRLEIINRFKYSASGSKGEKGSEIKSMQNLFDKMDKDEKIFSFVGKALKDDIKINTITDFDTILNIVPAAKADIFHKNISRIVACTDGEERIQALLKHVENPFFTTDKIEKSKNGIIKSRIKKESKFSKMYKFVENKINIMRYNRINPQEPITNVVSAKDIFIKPIASPQISTTPVATTQSRGNYTLTPTTDSMPTGLSEREMKYAPKGKDLEKINKRLNLISRFKESPQARKLRITKDINNIIKQKLGAKTLEKQQRDYEITANVMRLKMLPEIFDSIKAVRKETLAKGMTPKVKTKDAIDLFQNVNGKNKKIVNYMLKQTNDNNERIFDIKDIIKKLDSIEENIKIAKAKNAPNKLSSKEIKAIFDNEYEAIKLEYGKLKRQKKAS